MIQDSPVNGLSLADVAPARGFDFAGAVIMARKGHEMLVEHRLPLGTLMDQNNPAHVLGWFMANAAPQLLPTAQEAYRAALAKQDMGRLQLIGL